MKFSPEIRDPLPTVGLSATGHRLSGAPLLTPMSPNTWEQYGHSAPSAPLSKPFVLNHLQEEPQLRPSAPLRKSFVFNKRCKTRAPRKLNESNQLRYRAPAKSFRIISFQKNNVFALDFHQTPSNSQIGVGGFRIRCVQGRRSIMMCELDVQIADSG